MNKPISKLFAEVDGLKIAYQKAGQGKPLFFWHGWGGSKESWNDLMGQLKGLDREMVAIDFPGFGDSDLPKKAWGVEDYYLLMEHFIKEGNFDLKNGFDLAVHSFGGRVALKMFEYEYLSKKLDHLILIAAAGIKPRMTVKRKLLGMMAGVGKVVFGLPVLKSLAGGLKKVLYKLAGSSDYLKTEGVMRETFLKVIDEDLSQNLSKINQPTLIIWGDQDSYVPLDDAKLMEAKIEGSELKVIKGGRHGIHRVFAKDIAGWMREFLAN
ncbi:MAG: alpha/beta fold hydrolase [Candidatus Altimarinota bacterium]